MLTDIDDRHRLPVLGLPIDVVTASQARQRISAWAERRESRVVCICNAHSVVTAAEDQDFRDAVVNADLATPDGAPVAWMLKLQGARGQRRVSGPDLMLDYMSHAADVGEPVFLYGSTDETLQQLRARLMLGWPTLRIAGAHAPPFRPLTEAEDHAVIELINLSGARTVWVSLGCPKQEKWMAAHRGRVQATMIGVGAAFDFHAGTLRRAPMWMRSAGLEWLHRLVTEPRRLWRRYLSTNTAFLVGALRQIMGTK